MDDSYEMFQLADLLEGVSVDFPKRSAKIPSAGIQAVKKLFRSNICKQLLF